jgi:threonine synthase
MNDTISFEQFVDRTHPAESSLVLRYLKACGLELDKEQRAAFRHWLAKASTQESVRIFPLLNHRGVEVHLLDETSGMHTRTFKSIDGCVSAAYAKLRGFDRVVFESGGNLGAALTTYAHRLGIETFCFVPQANLHLLNGRTFANPTSHLIAVKDRGKVKEVTHRFAQQHALPLIPEVEWRFDAAMFRGLFILEQIIADRQFDWLTQTISAAFGPIGIYRVLDRHRHEITTMPRFLGVQQATNCPMFRAWRARQGDDVNMPAQDEPLLVSVMYDVRPQTHGTYGELEQILTDTGGDMTTVGAAELDIFMQRRFDGHTALELLVANDVEMALNNGDLVEKAGMIALAGLVKEIDRGTITAGSKVLCCLTGGASQGDGSAVPEHYIDSVEEVDQLYQQESWQ